MEDKKTKLSPPWIEYYRKLEAMFGPDPDIKVEFNEDEMHIKLYVESHEKSTALDELLPVQKDFGNVSVFIEVIPANDEPTKMDLLKRVFEGNPIFSYAATLGKEMGLEHNYIVFKHQLCQFWNDNYGDINGNCTMLYEDVARDIFKNVDGVFFNTDTQDNPGKPIK